MDEDDDDEMKTCYVNLLVIISNFMMKLLWSPFDAVTVMKHSLRLNLIDVMFECEEVLSNEREAESESLQRDVFSYLYQNCSVAHTDEYHHFLCDWKVLALSLKSIL